MKQNQALPDIVPAPEQRHLPFPLTDIQEAYWVGRSGAFELGNVSTHFYMEIDSINLDIGRLNLALQQLIKRHDMLRAIILSDGQQQILEHVAPYEIEVLDLRRRTPQEVEAELETVRRRMSHQVLPSDRWPLFEFRASRLGDRKFRLHLSLDMLTLDARSQALLFYEWSQFYQDPNVCLPTLELSFRDYVMAEIAMKKTELYQRDLEYWKDLSSSLPLGSDLPLAKDPSTISRAEFTTQTNYLDSQTWECLKAKAMQRELKPSALLLAAFSEVLRTWSKESQFTINVTLFNRMAHDPRLKGVMGDFTSSLLLCFNHSDQVSFETRALNVQQQLRDHLKHSLVSGVQVIRELSSEQGGKLRAMMPIVFTSLVGTPSPSNESVPTAWLGESAWLGENVYTISQTPQVWLDHQVREQSGKLVFNWDFIEELFPDGLLQDMFSAYDRFLRHLSTDDSSWQETWPETVNRLVPPAQLELRETINAIESPKSGEMLHTLFAEQVHQRGDKPAVVSSDRTLTYEELFRQSNQVAHHLRELGAQPNTLVAVVMEKGWEQVVAVLGILASGAAYLPIDAGLPKERLWYLLEHGQVEFVLTQAVTDQTLQWPDGLQRICVDGEELTDVDDRPLDPVQGPEDLAYVIYTSGSTGLPKGVMIDHRGAANTILDINERFGVGPNDRILALSALSFDLSVYDIFGTLAAGGTIIMPEQTETRDPSRWAQRIVEEKVTIWNSVPALMELLIEYVAMRSDLSPFPLRLVLMSGDWIPVTLPSQIRAQFGDIQIISLGGATEASIWSILYPIEQVDPAWKSIPYGNPMVNQRFYVLNKALVSCPVWVPGQLYIGGIGLAKGYWRDEEKTQASFITHPRTGERLYRTGDLGRFLPDGNIEFLGREDFQVQIQGYRVELGEIEAALAQHPEVRTVVVTAVGELQGEKLLAAYVVPEQRSVPAPSHLRQFLEQKLPDYMIPSAFVMLEELPLTPNGKVDRKALPDPRQLSSESLQYPSAEEKNFTAQIGQLVTRIIGINPLDPEANLLNLGATSVQMIRISNLLEKELNFRPRIDEFYRLPTVLGLARSYEQHLHQSQKPKETVDQFLVQPTPESLLAGFELILDPEDREAFKNKEPGLRMGEGEKPYIELAMAERNDIVNKQYAERRSHRQFSPKTIAFAQFSKLLSYLAQIRVDGKPKYLYGSAGGLYPVQTYLYVKPGRVETVGAGIYYYHPRDHRLVLFSENSHIDRDVYDPIINAPIFDQAAFAIFFIAQLSAIVPMYGQRSMHYATIEAGLMSQLLETSAPAYGIGLCQIGDMDFKQIRHLFALDQSHVLVHSLLGGLMDTHVSDRLSSFQEVDFGAVGGESDWEEGEI